MMVRAVRWGSLEGTSANPKARRHLPPTLRAYGHWMNPCAQRQPPQAGVGLP